MDPENLSSFVGAYQSAIILKLGELWAIPIMLRLALIENLRRVAARIAASGIDRNRADHWADLMAEVAGRDPKSLILAVSDMARSDPPMASAFVAELTRRLQGQGPALVLPLTWIEQRLSESGLTIEQLVRRENQQQAADQISMSNSIGSLRFLSAMDWREFVETMSSVEQTLGQDPGDIYTRMDFATRDRYRHVIEKLAKSSPRSEIEVALEAIRLAREAAADNGSSDRTAHVGFYLIDEGLRQLEATIQSHRSTLEALQRWCRRFPLLCFLGPILLITFVFTAGFLSKAYGMGYPRWIVALISLPLLLCASHLAVALANWLATLLAAPRLLPRMDFSSGIPSELRTLAVIPTILMSAQNIEELVEALEVRFLANRDEHLHFGLLTDFRDAPSQMLVEDEPLLELAQLRIRELNQKYHGPNAEPFFLFHRPRLWNPLEQIWMGYERKRGKLADLNALLRGDPGDRFALIVGDTSILTNIKYVITLDTDTQLPRDAARQFVGAMAHPLNHPQYNEDKQRIDKGYGILQPRVAVSLPGVTRSRYARLWSSEPGIDPYTRVVSDVYQDLFDEGSYIGKGIYDVEAFEQALKGRLPENLILSHDLVEGSYARAGLLSDVLLYEDYPPRYGMDVSRRHRWIRGDWQIFRWLLPGVPGLDGHRRKNPLSRLSRWKIFDNLRRSLVPAGLTVLLLIAWTVLSPAWLWTLAAISAIVIPPGMAAFLDLFHKADDVRLDQHLALTLRSTGRRWAQAAFTLTCLPYEAFFSLDAIVQTAWRMGITHKRLLEWNPPKDAKRQSRTDQANSWRTMWSAPVLAAATGIYLTIARPAALGVAGPILALWLVSPAVAWWIGRPPARHQERLTTDQIFFLRKLSRKTWAFFETFVDAQNHWLPPDNYQEHPTAVTAHRTSPTNMGLALLANLSAYDFGYSTAGQLLERTTQALGTMETLERYRGHFYNWYDTQTLKPLPPLYISSVDSGNLAGYLLTLQPGLLELADHKIIGTRLFEGLSDTFGIVADTAADTAKVYTSAQFTQLRQELASATRSPPTTLTASRRYLNRLATSAAKLVADIEVVDTDPESQLGWWAHAFAGQCRNAVDEVAFLAPWTDLLYSPDSFANFPDLDDIPTLRGLATLGLTLSPIIDQQLISVAPSEQNARLNELQRLVTTASRHAEERLTAIERLARQCGTFSLWTMTSYLTSSVTCCLSASMSAKTEGTRVTTIFWLRKPDLPVSSRLPRGNCPRKTGSPWDACSRRRGKADPAVVERFDVRIPDAAPGDADLPRNAARPDL